MKTAENATKTYLLKLGFQPNLSGYRYLVHMISSALKGEDLLPLKYCGYACTAKFFKKSVETVEKDVQNAIAAAWLKADVDTLYEEFGETVDDDKGKPTNKHFIVTAVERLSE